jgi:hypothetical protein
MFLKIESAICDLVLPIRNVQVGSPDNPTVLFQTRELRWDSGDTCILIEVPPFGVVPYRKMSDSKGGVVLTVEHLPKPPQAPTFHVHISNRRDFLAYEEHGEGSGTPVQ